MRDLVACKDCDRVFFAVRTRDLGDNCPDCGNDGKGSMHWYRVIDDAW
ncbi:hypothetical protein [Halorubrum trueperi]|uniref:Rubrerythrin-like domain-containing protein n=1 Tax=Halorubrum trueperi TaxID=2004704 RepID=A0ABD5UFI1_9EURY